MNCLAWNVRGFGNPRAFRELQRLIDTRNPMLLFLSETKLVTAQCRNWKSRLRFDGHFTVDCENRRGGLMMLWREPLEITITSFSQGHIDCIAKHESKKWRFTGFYGNPETSKRDYSWQLLRRLCDIHELKNLPWLIGGDFNEILFDSEKVGGGVRPFPQMNAFSEAIEDCGLQDLQCKGDPFTWCNKRQGKEVIFERLDRYLCTFEWHMMFPSTVVENLSFSGSDHRPIFLNSKPGTEVKMQKRPKRFNFEHKWLMEEDFTDLFQQIWERSSLMSSLPSKLEQCSSALKLWAGNRFHNLSQKITKYRKELERLMTAQLAKNNTARILFLEKEIEKLTEQEELHWKQRARVNWLSQGDRNTKFFHFSASARRKINCIHGLMNASGTWCTDEKNMAETVTTYFAHLFSSSNPTQQDINMVTETVLPVVDSHMNDVLCARFSADEVRKAVFDMHPSKAPGPDGFTALFYQKLWPLIGNEITAAALSILNENGDLSEWNTTLVTLIPKIQEPLSPKDFRPISLCNTCYKIVARAITNRFRPVLRKVIDPFQSAFIPGRLITDNVIVGFECMHWIRSKIKSKSGFAALKLDMSKAYDRVEWNFLKAIMIKMGFAVEWVNLLMKCISTVSYSFKLNQSIFGETKPKRGLRQGDPLSPYLFALCAQGLSSMITKAVEQKLFKGVKIANSSPIISHLFFADDSLVFFRATREDCLQVRRCLQEYEKASGQLINYEKSALTFSPSTTQQAIASVKEVLNIEVVKGHDIYLGLPTFSMRSKRVQFAYLRERLCQKTKGWSTKFFFIGGREILIKSVLQAIPSYAMSCFKIPVSLCREIERVCAKFWWNDTNERHGMHWTNWAELCKPKRFGGMGFRNTVAFNKSLLAKQVWRIIQTPDSLMARVLKARYFKHNDIMGAELGSKPSYIWRSLIWSRELIRRGMCWRVGDGKHISAFKDPWIPGIPSCKSSRDDMMNYNDKVERLILPTGAWNENLVRTLFPQYEAEVILDIPLSRRGFEDTRYWKWHSKGFYSVKTGYLLETGCFDPPPFQSSHPLQPWWKLLWSLHIPPKVRIFMWRASRDTIPTEQNLNLHHVPITAICSLCRSKSASTSHAILFCSAVRHAWKNSELWPIIKTIPEIPFIECGIFLSKVLEKEKLELFSMISWAIWSEICKFKHASHNQVFIIKIDWAISLLEAFHKVNSVCSPVNHMETSNSDRDWKCPARDQLRMDVDAGFDSLRHQYSVGVVIRDHMGRIHGAKASIIRNPGSIRGAELEAIRVGMEFCLRCGFNSVDIYSDSLQAVQAVTNPVEELGPEGIVSSEITSYLLGPEFLSIKHMRRTANKVAHHLASFALFSLVNVEWIGCNYPTWLLDFVSSDLRS